MSTVRIGDFLLGDAEVSSDGHFLRIKHYALVRLNIMSPRFGDIEEVGEWTYHGCFYIGDNSYDGGDEWTFTYHEKVPHKL